MGGTMSAAKAAAVSARDFTTHQLSPAVRWTAVFLAAKAVFRAAKATAEYVKLVFVATPTLKEAQEAISYLLAYLSPGNSIGYNCSDLEHPALPAMSKNAVASIVSDPNVYNAVLQNPEFQALLQSLNVDLSGISMDLIPDWLQGIYRWLQGIFESLKDMYQKMKDAVVGMMTNIFDYLKKLFRDTWDAVVGMMNYIFDYLKKLFPGTSDAVVGMMTNVFNYLKKLFRDTWDALVGIMTKFVDKNLCGDKLFVEIGALGVIVSSVIVIIAILLKRRFPHFKGF